MGKQESLIEKELRKQFEIPQDRKLGKYDIGWLRIFSEKPILDEVSTAGYTTITASEQKSLSGQLEPRLLNKHDFSKSQPYIFSREKLGMLPIERNRYLIGKFDVFCDFPDTSNLAPKSMPFPADLESINFTDLSSEAVALHASSVSGMLNEFLGVERLQQTVSGRMGSGSFEIDLNSIPGGHTATVLKAQVEIDGGYESPESLTLVEAKNTISSDFNVRQVFYPYRIFSERMKTKPVRNVYQVYSDGIFHFYEFGFDNPRDLTTIQFLRAEKYALSTESVTRQDIQSLAANAQPIPHRDRRIPFPQADVFTRLVNLCEKIYGEGAMTKEEIHLSQDFTPRQADYYLNAGRYIGLLTFDSASHLANLTEEGRDLMAQPSARERRLRFAKAICGSEPFLLTLRDSLRHGEIPSRARVIDNMSSLGLEGTTLNRRASTVEGWVRWILNTIAK